MRMKKWYWSACLVVAVPIATFAGEGDKPFSLLQDLVPLSTEVLDASTAKAQIQVDKIVINENDLDGVVTDNVAIGNTTGNNVVSDGAFSSSTGFMTTIQNTGNNVLIQNATIINVSVGP